MHVRGGTGRPGNGFSSRDRDGSPDVAGFLDDDEDDAPPSSGEPLFARRAFARDSAATRTRSSHF